MGWGYELFASFNDMGPLTLPTPRDGAHTVLAVIPKRLLTTD
jgi:hypothetical protein